MTTTMTARDLNPFSYSQLIGWPIAEMPAEMPDAGQFSAYGTLTYGARAFPGGLLRDANPYLR